VRRVVTASNKYSFRKIEIIKLKQFEIRAKLNDLICNLGEQESIGRKVRGKLCQRAAILDRE
jgi:hypothetical protein